MPEGAEGPQVAAQNAWLNLPLEMRERKQWALAAHDKSPMTVDGRRASSIDPSTWSDFETVCQTAAARGYGIGYMLYAADPFTCIDIDVKDDTPPEQMQRFLSIVDTFDSYTEHSRSGRGFHVWLRGKIGDGKRRDGVEVYSQTRFMICTGNVLRARPIAEGGEALTNMVSQMSGEAGRRAKIELWGDDTPDWSAADLAANDSGELGRLFKGDWQGRYESQSEADLALCKLLLPLTDSPLECWRTFQLSELGKRDKAKRPHYVRSTMGTAMQHCANDACHRERGASFADAILTNHDQRATEGDKTTVASVEGHPDEAERSSNAGEAGFSAKPRNVLRRIDPPRYSFEDVPPCIGEFAFCYSQATGLDQSGAIVSAVVAAASVISDDVKLTVRQQSEWQVSARLWAFLCGSPAAGKSPSIRAATDPIKRMHEAEVRNWQNAIKDAPPEDQPTLRALYTSDTTIAALSDALMNNPRGMLMLTEEFSSLIGAIDSADRGEAAKNRGDWLRLRDGGGRQILRVTRGPVYVSNWGVSILAACTPSGLAKQMKHMPEDGLIQRFIPCVMANPDLDANGDARAAMAAWGQKLDWVFRQTEYFAGHLAFTSDAQAMFNAEERAIKELVISSDDFSPGYAAHLGKHPGMLAEVALVFHLFSTQDGQVPTNAISEATVACAIRFMRTVRRHAYTLYSSILSAAPSFELAQAIARSIVASEQPITTVGRDWMTQHCQGFKKAEDKLRREAVQILEDADWLSPETSGRRYSGWPKQFFVNQQVFQIFAREGELWRARRAAVRDAIGDTEQ
ncbi:DUF3987 domain-containing protein [Novosphingobium humi]|uniref:DUF3987 domain-containing protein n=1 Tax=Novosphingobium humi TaxID=2282397 RepID=UPI0025AF5A84|nr:DUF3987 domain-containing protein [Novosphingobium humi]WJT00081.1 DUF3987 domain-containing protein [Novosphingobium humi]